MSELEVLPDPPKDPLDMPLLQALSGAPERVRIVFSQEEPCTVGEFIVRYTPQYLLRFRGIGKHALGEILLALQSLGSPVVTAWIEGAGDFAMKVLPKEAVLARIEALERQIVSLRELLPRK